MRKGLVNRICEWAKSGHQKLIADVYSARKKREEWNRITDKNGLGGWAFKNTIVEKKL